MAKIWANKLSKMSNHQRVIAEKGIMYSIYESEMETLSQKELDTTTSLPPTRTTCSKVKKYKYLHIVHSKNSNLIRFVYFLKRQILGFLNSKKKSFSNGITYLHKKQTGDGRVL